jgi:hypothetical protein
MRKKEAKHIERCNGKHANEGNKGAKKIVFFPPLTRHIM